MNADENLYNLGASNFAPSAGSNTAGETAEEQSPSPAKTWLKRILWSFFAVFCLLFFTLLKLPEDRIKNYIRGSIASVLSAQGIGFSSSQEILSIGWGVSYVMKDVTLTVPPAGEMVKIDQISVAPAIFPALTGKLGGKFWIKQGLGALHGAVSMKGNQVEADIDATGFELHKTGLLPALAGFQGNATISGKVLFVGDPNQPSSWEGKINLDLKNVGLDPQNVMGFSIPKVTVSQGKVDLLIDKSKLTIRTFQLGKAGNTADDLQATVTGDLQLAKSWNASTVNIRTNFGLSPTILKSFAILDTLLGAGKQPDGTYSFQFNGPMTGVVPSPVAPGAR